MRVCALGQGCGNPAEESGRHMALTSSLSIPAQERVSDGLGEGLAPLSSQEDSGHQSGPPPHVAGERCLLRKSWCPWEGRKGYWSAQTSRGSTPAHQLKRRGNETEGLYPERVGHSVW